MKRINRYLLIAAGLLLVGISCKKDKKFDEPPAPQAGAKPAQIELPAGSTFDLSDAELISLGNSYQVTRDGKTQVQDLKKVPHIAYLFDKNDNPILAGFITDSTSTISPATTAKVLLYYAYGVRFRPDTVTKIFFNRIQEMPGVNEWINEFTNLWKNDPQVLMNGGFTTQLQATMDKLRRKPNTVDIATNKTSDIVVDEADKLSGIQLAQEELGKLNFSNFYRRRAHAFLYKMKYKDMNGTEHTIIKDINANTTADKELIVDPAAANTSVTGQLGAMVEGSSKMDEYAVVKSGPVVLDLNEFETEATWKVRIVGPGVPHSKQPVTSSEIFKLTRLEVETFALDFMLPLIMETLGWHENLSKYGVEIGKGPVEEFIDLMEVFIKSTPEVYEEIRKGNYGEAAFKGMLAIFTNGVDKDAEKIVAKAAKLGMSMILKIYGEKPTVPLDEYKAAAKNMLKILKIVNAAMLGGDFLRILYGVVNSHQLEEWEIRARSSQVRLSPRESKMIPLDQKKISAEIKNMEETGDTHPYFEWETTGKFGYIKDTKGNEGKKFGSADKDIFYNCNTTNDKLTDGDNWEYIYITARMGERVIGKDTAKINVRKHKYKIVPDGITLSGKGNSANQVKLYIQRVDGVSDIKPNPALDYKIVWSTAARHGGFVDGYGTKLSTMTNYDDNAISYKCTDDETKESTETVTARIYSKPKGEGEFRLFEEIKGTVKINNDDKKRFEHKTMEYYTGCWTEGNCFIHPIAYVDIDEKATKYSVRFYNFTGTSTIGDNEYIYTWNKGGYPPTYYHPFPDNNDISGNTYYVSFGRTWCAGPPSSCNIGSTAAWKARYIEMYGASVKVEITYYY